MSEIARFRGCRVWRRPLLQRARQRAYARKACAVSGEAGSGVLTFEKQSGVWVLTECPRFLTYLRGTKASDVRLELQKLGLSWHWR